MPKHGDLVIRSGRVLLPDGNLMVSDVLIEDGIIRRLDVHAPAAKTEIDAAGCYVLPGLIDLHTHGIHDVSGEAGALVDYARLEAAHGATTFYAALFSSPEEAAEQLRRHRRETDELRLVPQVAGFRLEAPYLATASGGPAASVIMIRQETTDALLDAGGGHVKIWDVSPELPAAPEFVASVTARGIVVSIAHTRATTQQARAVVDAGARLVTHLYDVFFYMPEKYDPDPDIYAASMLDYLLIEDRLTCEIIADGTHVDPILVEKTFRCKPSERLVFVTDSNYGAGLPPGQYTLPGGWGHVQIDGPNGGVRLVDRGMILGGSALTPIDSFRNAVRLFGKDLPTASRIWSRNQARLMGLNKGEIAADRDGDVIILSQDLDLLYTVAGGDVIYRRA